MKSQYCILNIIFLFCSILFFSSCEEIQEDYELPKPKAKGSAGEVLVVINQEYWNSKVWKSVSDVFEEEVTSLPQPEPLFVLSKVEHKGFTQGMTHQRAIFVVNIDPNVTSSYITDPVYDENAIGQIIIRMKAPSIAKATEIIDNNAEGIREIYKNYALNNLIKRNKSVASAEIKEELELTLNTSLSVPPDYTVVANHNDFIWMQSKRTKFDQGQNHEIQQGIFVYTYPYLDSNAFTLDAVINKRDSICKKYVAGFIKDSYMTTEKDYGLSTKHIEVNDQFVMQTSGVWKMHGAIMGGPFINFTTFDESLNRIVVYEGYVFAPNFKKMDYLREVKSILHTFSL